MKEEKCFLAARRDVLLHSDISNDYIKIFTFALKLFTFATCHAIFKTLRVTKGSKKDIRKNS